LATPDIDSTLILLQFPPHNKHPLALALALSATNHGEFPGNALHILQPLQSGTQRRVSVCGDDDINLESVADFDVSFRRAREAVYDEGEDVVKGEVEGVRAASRWELVFEVDLGTGMKSRFESINDELPPT
jgi:hypothetical protein